MRLVYGQAPTRISFFGGGTDLPEYYQKNNGGCVLSTTINKHVFVTIRETDWGVKIYSEDYRIAESHKADKPLKLTGNKLDLVKEIINNEVIEKGLMPKDYGLEIILHSDIPAGSGVGTSSTAAVAMIRGLCEFFHLSVTKEDIAQKAVKIERQILKMRGGKQDQYAASYGGFNFIEFFSDDKVRITPLFLETPLLSMLRKRIILCYTERVLTSGEMQKYLVKSIKKRKSGKKALDQLKALTYKMKEEILKGNIDEFGKGLHQGWQLKIESNPEIAISSPLAVKLYDLARQKGALGGKLSGAGAGGFLLFYCPLEKKDTILAALAKEGGKFYDFDFESQGAIAVNGSSL